MKSLLYVGWKLLIFTLLVDVDNFVTSLAATLVVEALDDFPKTWLLTYNTNIL